MKTSAELLQDAAIALYWAKAAGKHRAAFTPCMPSDSNRSLTPDLRQALDAGKTASWFYGEPLEAERATLVDAFAAAFTGAPSVSARQVLGVGHNIDHHHAGSQYRHDVLDWAGNLPAREETA